MSDESLLANWLGTCKMGKHFSNMSSNGFYLHALKGLDDEGFTEMCNFCEISVKGEQLVLKSAWRTLKASGPSVSQDPPPYVLHCRSLTQAAVPPAEATQNSQSLLNVLEGRLASVKSVLDEQEPLDFLDRRLDGPADKLKAVGDELKAINITAGDILGGKKKAGLVNDVSLLNARLLKLRVPESPKQEDRIESQLNNKLEALATELGTIEVKTGELQLAKKKANLEKDIKRLKARIRNLRAEAENLIQIRVGDVKWKHHTDHPLQLRNCPYGPRTMATCRMCQNKVSISFHCAMDGYDVCVNCVAKRNPDSVRHAWRSAKHPHPLHLVADPYPGSGFICDQCEASICEKAVYHCPACDYDCCIRCALGVSSPSTSSASASASSSSASASASKASTK